MIDILKFIADHSGMNLADALKEAYEQGKQDAQPEPCEDAVSREAVSKWLKQYGQDVLHGKYKFSLMYIWKNLMDLPSVTPKAEQRWIPCYPSELPKNMLLWVTFDDGYGYRYVENVFWDMTEWNMDVSNAIAYMPYEEPEPYKEGSGE